MKQSLLVWSFPRVALWLSFHLESACSTFSPPLHIAIVLITETLYYGPEYEGHLPNFPILFDDFVYMCLYVYLCSQQSLWGLEDSLLKVFIFFPSCVLGIELRLSGLVASSFTCLSPSTGCWILLLLFLIFRQLQTGVVMTVKMSSGLFCFEVWTLHEFVVLVQGPLQSSLNHCSFSTCAAEWTRRCSGPLALSLSPGCGLL